MALIIIIVIIIITTIIRYSFICYFCKITN